MSELVLVTGPAVEPIDLATAKAWLRIDQPDEDMLVTSLIKAAREQVEADTGRILVEQSWRWVLDQRWVDPTVQMGVMRDLAGMVEFDEWERPVMWPGYEQRVQTPLVPLQAVTQITYRLGGADATYDVANLRTTAGGMIVFPAAHPFPLSDERYASVTIDFTVGYGADATTVPDWALQAMRFLLAHWYENRIPVMTGRSGMGIELPDTYKLVIGAKRRVTI